MCIRDRSDKAGAFEAANGGMLFLDEVHRLDAQGQDVYKRQLQQYEMSATMNALWSAGR